MKKLYIIAGCNCAGKTTASFTILPEILDCREFVNADEIARGLSPFQPEKVAFEAGRIMLTRIKHLINSKQNFAFETTLATKSYVNLIKKAKEENYKILLLFLYLNSKDLAVARVKSRVKEGGHNIAENIIKRRYDRGLSNFFNLYLPIIDYFDFVDNSTEQFSILAKGERNNMQIFNNAIWNKLKDIYHEEK